MKKSIYTFALSLFVAGTILTSCGPSENKVDAAKANIESAEKDLIKAKEDYYKEYNEYKYASEKQIADNKARISELRKFSKEIKKDIKAEYETKINQLEERNNALQSMMDAYSEAGNDKWESFKREFSHDMDELGQSIIDMNKNNVK